MSLLGGLD